MCFDNDTEMPAPTKPPEVLEQDAPEKKTANKQSANALAIGTKAYRNETGLGWTGKSQKVKPKGPSVSV